jgi:hypothetical protein
VQRLAWVNLVKMVGEMAGGVGAWEVSAPNHQKEQPGFLASSEGGGSKEAPFQSLWSWAALLTP